MKTHLDGNEVLERLGHLEPVDVEVTSVEEVVHPLSAAIVCLSLGDLVVVVRECKVNASRVNIEFVPKDVADKQTNKINK